MASPELGRTAATLYLTLTLLRSAHPNLTAADVGVASLPLPGLLKFGDGDSTVDDETDVFLRLEGIDEELGHLVARATIPHTYPRGHRYDGEPWLAVFKYCCRGSYLRNNQETLLTLSTEVDLTHSSSPLLPPITTLTFQRSSARLQEFFLTGHHPEAHPLLYTLGTPRDYHSAQSGPPQGLGVSYTTGQVTWNTSHVTPGSYSVQVVVVDGFTDIRVGFLISMHLYLKGFVAASIARHYFLISMHVHLRVHHNWKLSLFK